MKAMKAMMSLKIKMFYAPAISCYPILMPVLTHWHPTRTLKKSSSKPVLRTGTGRRTHIAMKKGRNI